MIGTAQWLRRHTTALSSIGLVLMALAGGAYLLLDVMRINPARSTYTVTVQMDRSGGLQPTNDVTLRGYRVGRITAITLTGKGVAASAEIDSKYKIPQNTAVAVRPLSAAGEQYIDFRPRTDSGPYLTGGSVVSNGVQTPTPVSKVLTDNNSLIAQIDPKRMGVIVDELDKALAGGPDQLRQVVTGLSIASTGLEGLLPQTTHLVNNLRTIASTTTHAQPDLGTLARNSKVIFDAADAADAELRRLLDNGPSEMGAFTTVLGQTADPLTRVAQDFVAITRAAQMRSNAMSELFPAIRIGTRALGVPTHDGAFHALVDLYPRPTCEYPGVIPAPPNLIVNEGRVRLYNYCPTNNPNIQVRGSANAPRPAVPDNGAQRPPGVDPNQLSRPLPDPDTW
ncbi:MAG: MCE family protein [Mycobacteriaceae bacterium]|nr:MCE family protein [Mycobacteriaceae bacterium]